MPAGASAQKLNVVILYHQLASMGRAMATYLRLVRELADEYTADFRVWRIDAALEPVFADEAARDIAAAELIIITVNGRQQCPPQFQRWLGVMGQAGAGIPHAIIALVEASDETVPPAESWGRVLRESAAQIHPEIFVCPAPNGPGWLSLSATSLGGTMPGQTIPFLPPVRPHRPVLFPPLSTVSHHE